LEEGKRFLIPFLLERNQSLRIEAFGLLFAGPAEGRKKS
jgi:hypothetical protein